MTSEQTHILNTMPDGTLIEIPETSSQDFYTGWEFPFLWTLGYTFDEQNGKAPTAYRCVPHPIHFIPDSNEVAVEEIVGPEDATGLRQAQIDPADSTKLLTTIVIHSMPTGWEIVTMLTATGLRYVIALPKVQP